MVDVTRYNVNTNVFMTTTIIIEIEIGIGIAVVVRLSFEKRVRHICGVCYLYLHKQYKTLVRNRMFSSRRLR